MFIISYESMNLWSLARYDSQRTLYIVNFVEHDSWWSDMLKIENSFKENKKSSTLKLEATDAAKLGQECKPNWMLTTASLKKSQQEKRSKLAL